MKAAFSAPGKALLAGGYLVLDEKYCGYSIALSARIHAVVEVKDHPTGGQIICKSPQFQQGEWAYTYDDGAHVTQVSVYGRNPFVESAIKMVTAYGCGISAADTQTKKNIDITIYSDDAYHSRDSAAIDNKIKSTDCTRYFTYHEQAIGDTPKTGLGSSAALTVSVCACLYYGLVGKIDKDIIYRLAQLAHCAAQGKIGSGFDVASATYGSVRYRRFPNSLIDGVMQKITPESVKNSVEDPRWSESTHEPCKLPGYLGLMMGDVHSGSESPKMAAKVLAWRMREPAKAEQVWNALDKANMGLVRTLQKGGDSRTKKEQIETQNEIRKDLRDIRTQLRTMTRETGADIEPESQSALLDACEKVPGVVGGVVPGAGGYDAISVIVVKNKVDYIREQTAHMKEFENVRWLDVHEEGEGLREEDISTY